jgi:cytochrome c peroxidase
MSIHRPRVLATAVVCLLLGIGGTGALAVRQAEQEPQAPLGLPPIPWPDDNHYSKEKWELGRLLYFDKRLSSSGTIACATCHDPTRAFTDAAPVSTGIRGQKGNRSAPTVINRAYSTSQFWDGRAPSLEEQAKGPLANPLEMTSAPTADAAHLSCVDCLRGMPGYRERFKQVFGTENLTIDHVAKAIATFERTILSGNSPFDRHRAGDRAAMTPDQVRGMNLFFSERVGCDSCHLGFNFTDGSYVNIGIGADKPVPDAGRYLVTKREEDRGAFKTPTLREVEHTAPYMHDGRFKTLAEVIDHYDKGGIKNPNLHQRMRPLNLNSQEKQDLVAFLKALSGEGWQQIAPPPSFPD